MKFPIYTWLEPEPYNNLTFSKMIPYDPILIEVLNHRGFLTTESITSFINIDQFEPASAFELPNIEESARLVINAIKNDAQIYIYGLSDIDAQMAVTILVDGLKKINNDIKISYTQYIKRLYNKIPVSSTDDLVIYCGDFYYNHQFITNDNLSKIVIGSQRDFGQISQTTPVISPQWLSPSHPLKNLSTSGCILKLLEVINRLCGKPIERNNYLDLAAIGTIASHNLLIGENRYIVARGLDQIRSNPRLSLHAMFRIMNKSIDNIEEDDIQYFIIPRLYVFDRQGSNTFIPDFLLTDDRQDAHLTALKLEGSLSKRNLDIDQVLKSANQIIHNDSALLNNSIIILDNETWPIGVINEVARKLVNQYQKPFILISKKDAENWSGYARTIEEFDLFKTLSNTEDLLHTLNIYQNSATFEIILDNIAKFKKHVIYLCDDLLTDQTSKKTLMIDKYITFSELTESFVKSLRVLAPYGPGNPKINFAAKDLKIAKISHFGRDNQHLRLRLSDQDGNTIEMIMWNRAAEDIPDSEISVVFQIKTDSINSDADILYEILDIEPANKNEKVYNKKHQIVVYDYRHHTQPELILNDLIHEEEITVYAEGNIEHKISNIKNRYNLDKSNKVVLWTVPPGKNELREIIKAVSPSFVYIFGNINTESDVKRLINTLGAMINYAFENYHGILSIPKLAAATNQRESTINLGIKYLEAMGKIKILEASLHKIKVEKDGVSNREHAKTILENLQKLLNETTAFQNYYLNNDPYHLILN